MQACWTGTRPRIRLTFSSPRLPWPKYGRAFTRWIRSIPTTNASRTFAAALPHQYRVLNFDARAAAIWGEITGRTKSPLPLRDSLIAAIARSRGCRVVTRDTEPFERAGCKVVNPWK